MCVCIHTYTYNTSVCTHKFKLYNYIGELLIKRFKFSSYGQSFFNKRYTNHYIIKIKST